MIIINKRGINNVFQSIYTTIIETQKNLQEKVEAGLLIQLLIILLVFQNIIP